MQIQEKPMKRELITFVVAMAVAPAVFAQATLDQTAGPQQETVMQAEPAVHENAPQGVTAQDVILRDGTPIRMRLARTISSEHAKAGEQIDFDVLDDVTVGGRIVIARGAKALGVITDAEHKKRMARGGKLNMTLDYVRLQDGTKVALRGNSDARGGGHVGAMTAGMAAAVVLGFGLPAPLFLFMHGKEAVVPQGTELTAYTNGDTRVNPPATPASWR
jgi:hypothetical protein